MKSSATRVYNFSAGPAVLPVPVLEQAQRELLSLPGVGMSVLEVSHRSKPFEEILARAEADIRTLAIPAKRLLKRETTIADEWPGYPYGRDTWLSEAGLRGRRQAEAVMALDCAVESRLYNQVGPAYDALKADPSRAVTADKVRERLASEHAKGQGTKKIATIDEMNEGATAGWAGEAHQFTPPDIAS